MIIRLPASWGSKGTGACAALSNLSRGGVCGFSQLQYSLSCSYLPAIGPQTQPQRPDGIQRERARKSFCILRASLSAYRRSGWNGTNDSMTTFI